MCVCRAQGRGRQEMSGGLKQMRVLSFLAGIAARRRGLVGGAPAQP